MEDAINIEQIQHFVPFDELSEQAIEELMPHFRQHELGAKKILFKRGVHDDECHFLLSGEIDLADESFNITKVKGDDDENFLALDGSHPIHRCAGITQSACTFFSIKRKYLELITTWAELRQSYEQEDEQSDWLEALLTSNLFNRIPPANIQQLLAKFKERSVKLGEEVIKEGDEGTECYVIKTGKAVVTRKQGSKQETLAAISTGKLFGEDALVSAMPRNASITMSSDGELMVLTKEDFDTLLKQPVLEYLNEEQLKQLIDDGDTGTVIIDVRTPQEASANPVPRARNIPLAQLRSHLDELSKEFVHVLMGEGRGEAAAYILSEAGFQAKVLTLENEAPEHS
ncbi:cyclic nucleotide-binding domain-containing protein [Bacterioplanoides sp.]|uniref:cyclic nucleotide-binding domain-containing protein n=1 Tax=Bacterioplanoides sp. TaxID=2066072 RepID=UPI003B58F186